MVRFLRRLLSGQYIDVGLHVGEVSICLLFDMAGLLEVRLERLRGGITGQEGIVRCHCKSVTE